MLREVTRELLAEKSSPVEVRKLVAAPLGQQWSEPLWQQLAEVGLHGVTVDEQHGGQGLGLVEQAIILEEVGRAVMPGPYFPTVLATTAIRAGGDSGQMATYLPGIASGELKASVAVLEDRLAWRPEAI